MSTMIQFNLGSSETKTQDTPVSVTSNCFLGAPTTAGNLLIFVIWARQTTNSGLNTTIQAGGTPATAGITWTSVTKTQWTDGSTESGGIAVYYCLDAPSIDPSTLTSITVSNNNGLNPNVTLKVETALFEFSGLTGTLADASNAQQSTGIPQTANLTATGTDLAFVAYQGNDVGGSNVIPGSGYLEGARAVVAKLGQTQYQSNVSGSVSTAFGGSVPNYAAIAVAFLQASTPVLDIVPSSLTYTCREGGPSPADQTVTVYNLNGGTLAWTLTSDVPWLTATPLTGTHNTVVTVSASNTGLAPGIYTGNLTFTDPTAGNSPQVVTVTLTVAAVLVGSGTPPGFGKLRRQFLWRKWNSSFFWMGCDVDDTSSRVYKMELGTDSVPVLIWTSADPEPFDFVVSNNTCYFGNGVDMKKYDGSFVWNWGITPPAAGPALTLVTGTSIVLTSWCYCYTYYNANTGHESSPSPVSACSGTFTNKKVQVGLVASTDPQVTQIRVYRTPDGGAQDPSEMQEIQGSPFTNTNQTITDSTPDISLSIRVAPAFYRNDPPPPSKGLVAYGGRIWSYFNNTTYYSAFEETADPVPEECWPSGLDGNYYPWANEVMGQAPLLDGIAVFQAERISKVEGDSLDTFRRYTLLERRGTRNRDSIAALGGSVAWFDTAGQVWVSDLGEVGLPIRPDTAPIDQTQVEIAVHISGIYHWLVLLDGANGEIYVYDLDNRQWMPPWKIGNSASAMVSGETALGVVDLLVARDQTRSLKLVAGTYNDDGVYIPATANSNMYRLTPDNNPSWKGVHDWTEIKTDQNPPDKMEQLTDDNPATGTWVDLTANVLQTPDIIPGNGLGSWRYTSNHPVCQFLGTRFTWLAEDQNFHCYQWDIAFHQFGQ